MSPNDTPEIAPGPDARRMTPPPLPTVEVAALAQASSAGVKATPSGWLVPVAVAPWAVAAGYAGLFALIVFPAPLAVIFSLLAIRQLRTNRDYTGWGRAIFGLVTGIPMTVVLVIGALSLALR